MIRCGEPQIGDKERQNVLDVLTAGQLTRGQWVEEFEHRLGRYLGRPVLAVSSGTAALHLALLGVGVQPGDEVILPATTFVATLNAVLYCRAKPVIVDVDEKTWCICPDAARRAVTRRTKAIVPVHLYGVPAPLFDLQEIVQEVAVKTGRRIAVVEDAAEAFGARWRGQMVGTASDAAAFSFYGSKTITTGEGGAVVFRDQLHEQRARHLAGQAMTDRRYVHDAVGFNYRMTELQAAIGVAQLERLHGFIAKRAQVFAWYEEFLPEDMTRQVVRSGDYHGFWAMAVVKAYGRGGPMQAGLVASVLEDADIETRPVFPPVSTFEHVPMECRTSAFTASLLHQHGLVLPTHCGLTREDVEKVCQELRKAVSCS